MTASETDFLNALEEQAQALLGDHGRFCRNKSGLFRFEGEDVYFVRIRRDMVALTVRSERYELPLY